MKKFFLSSLVLLAVVLWGQGAQAGMIKAKGSAFELGFVPPVQLFCEDTTIYGMRISLLYTKNKAVYGIDLGVGNASEDSIGFQAAIWNHCLETQGGWGIGVVNCAERDMYGVQCGAFNQVGLKGDDEILDTNGTAKGAQFGWVNLSQSRFSGFQLGIINLSDSVFNGLQLGLFNCDKDPNYFVSLLDGKPKEDKSKDTCIQIGIINFNEKGYLPVSLFINF
jgi:hypothetical protein